MNPHQTLRFSAIAVSGFLAGQTSTAAVIVSTFASTPPGYASDSFAASRFTSLPLPGVPPNENDWAMSFTVPANSDYFLTGITAALFSVTGTPTADFTIAASNAVGAPGAALELIEIPVLSTSPAVYSGVSLRQPILTKGTTYWLELAAHDVNTTIGWNAVAGIRSGIAAGGVASGLSNFGSPLIWSVSNQTQAAFSILGTSTSAAVPEPGTAVLLAMGVLAACLRRFL